MEEGKDECSISLEGQVPPCSVVDVHMSGSGESVGEEPLKKK